MKVVSPTYRPPLPPQEIFVVLISVGSSVDPRAIVRGRKDYVNEKLQWGIEPATFWLVEQCLNQLRYGVPRYLITTQLLKSDFSCFQIRNKKKKK